MPQHCFGLNNQQEPDMGLFDFVKSVGKKIGIGDDEPSADALKKELDSHKLGTENVQVVVEGDKAVLKGNVTNQEILEKAIIAVGNSLGISKVETEELKVDEVTTGSVAKEPKFYTVKKGDNLWKIAESQYGKGKGAKNTLIFEANKPMLTHPDKIYPGQVLRIPELG
jgi:nucleoid-associated protein YgaU